MVDSAWLVLLWCYTDPVPHTKKEIYEIIKNDFVHTYTISECEKDLRFLVVIDYLEKEKKGNKLYYQIDKKKLDNYMARRVKYNG